MNDYITGLVVAGFLPPLVIAIFTWFAVKARQAVPERRRWGLLEPDRLTVCLAQSASTDTGIYLRPSTGIGQAKSLAMLAPSLSRAYRDVDLQGVRFPHQVGERLERDLLVLGGPKTNAIAARVLARLDELHGFSFNSEAFTFGEFCQEFPTMSIDLSMASDFGIVVVTKNPFSRKGHSLTLLAGLHTYGAVAATRYFLESSNTWFLPTRGWVALVVSDIQDGHVLAPTLVFRRSI